MDETGTPAPQQPAPTSQPAPAEAPRMSRATLVSIIVVAAVIVLAVLAYLFINTPEGAALLARYVAPQSAWPTPQEATSTPASQPVLVPKALASQSYYTALNTAITDFDLFGTLNNTQLTPLLLALNTRAGTGDPTLQAHIADAQTLVGQEQNLLAQFSAALQTLSTVNATVTDAQTESLTQAFIAQGTTTAAVASQYATMVSQALAAGSADATTVAGIYAQSSILAQQSTHLQATVSALTAYFAQTISASATTTTP